MTPLHVAAANTQPEMVLFLLSAGADVNVKDGEGRTPLQSESDDFDSVKQPEVRRKRAEMKKLLRIHGAVN